jgi:tetratricopeptide (TPR) repeat protein
VALAEQTDDPGALVRLEANWSTSSLATGQLDEAVAHGLKGADIARQEGYWNVFMWAGTSMFACFAYSFQGELAKAGRIAQELVRFSQDANNPDIEILGLRVLGPVQLLKGELDESIGSFSKLRELAEAVPNHLFRVQAGSWLGKCYARFGDLEKSMAVLEQAEEYKKAHGVMGWECETLIPFLATYLAAAERGSGAHREEYLRKAKRAYKNASRSARVYRNYLPELMMLQGRYEWIRGKPSSARAWWEKSIKTAEEMGERYCLGMTHLEIGRRLNDREHLQQAETIFADIGAAFDLAEARRLLQLF